MGSGEALFAKRASPVTLQELISFATIPSVVFSLLLQPPDQERAFTFIGDRVA